MARQKIVHEINSYHQILKQLDIPKESIYSVEFKCDCKKGRQTGERSWVCPPIILKRLGKKDVVIQGKVEGLSSKGLIYHGNDVIADLLKVWPLYLLIKMGNDSTQLVLTKKGKICDLIKADQAEQAFIRYLDYAERALRSPSPLMPNWASSFFKEGKIIESYEEDEITRWVSSRGLLPVHDHTIREWRPYLKNIFNELL